MMALPLQCLASDTLAVYNFSEQSRLDGQSLQMFCPTMLQQLDANSCGMEKEEGLSSEPAPRPTGLEGELWNALSVTCSIFKYSVNGPHLLKGCVFSGLGKERI